MKPRQLAAAAIGIALTACTAGQATPPEVERPVRTDLPAASIAPSDDAPVTGEVPAELLEDILADAASRTGIDASELVAVRAEETSWPNGSLGCPEPGQLYTQAIVDGYHVVVDAAGDMLDYRATRSGSFRLCEESVRPAG